MNFEDYETLPTQSVGTHMTAGAFAGVMEHCVMYPLDSVKTRMQSLGATQNTSILQTLRFMVRNEGIFRPVRGMSAVVCGAGPAHALYFSTYEFCKDKFTQMSNQRHKHFIYGLSGCLASLVHDAISNPTEVVKQRIQMYNSPYRGIFHCIRQTYRAEGFRAFYRSYMTTVMMNIPFQSIYFTTYEFMQSLTNQNRTYNPKAHVISGAVAGAIAAGITTPLDVCKTVLNTQEKQARAKGFWEAVHYISKISGPRGFFKGMLARVLYQMPAAAICWSTYETFKFLLRPDKDDSRKSHVIVDNKEKLNLRLVLPQASVMAENGKSAPGVETPVREPENPRGVKTMELPAVSGANLYGALSLNTIHQGDAQTPSLRHR